MNPAYRVFYYVLKFSWNTVAQSRIRKKWTLNMYDPILKLDEWTTYILLFMLGSLIVRYQFISLYFLRWEQIETAGGLSKRRRILFLAAYSGFFHFSICGVVGWYHERMLVSRCTCRDMTFLQKPDFLYNYRVWSLSHFSSFYGHSF